MTSDSSVSSLRPGCVSMNSTSSDELVDEVAEALGQPLGVVALAQDPGDLAGLHARRDEVEPARHRRRPGASVTSWATSPIDLSVPQEVVERRADVVAAEAEQDVDARRLDVGVDDADARARAGRARPRGSPSCSTCPCHHGTSARRRSSPRPDHPLTRHSGGERCAAGYRSATRQRTPARGSVAEVADPGHEHRPRRRRRRPRRSSASLTEPARLDEGGDARPRGRPRRRRGTGRRHRSAQDAPCSAVIAEECPDLRRRPGGRRRPGSSDPNPRPIRRPSWTRTMALLVTPADEPPGEVEVELLGVASAPRLVTPVQVAGSSGAASGAPTRIAPPALRMRADRARSCPAIDVVGEGLVDDDPEVRLRGQDRQGLGGVGRRDDDLEEDRDERLGDRPVDLAGEGDDATEGADRVGFEGRRPGVEERRTLRGAARVGVLDDDDGGAAKRPAQRIGGGRVEDVVVRERLALERRPVHREQAIGRRRSGPPVARRRLVRVLAVAQRLDLLETDRQGSPGMGRPADRASPASTSRPGSAARAMRAS